MLGTISALSPKLCNPSSRRETSVQPIAAPLRGGWTPDSWEWLSVLVVATPGSPGQTQHSSVPAGTTLSPSLPLSFFLSSVFLYPPPSPVFSNWGPAWQTGTCPFRRPFASSPFLSLFSSSALPLLLINLLLLLAGIQPHPGPYQLRSRDIECARHSPSPLMSLPLWLPLSALSPASFILSPLAYSPSVPLLPSPPLMPPANFTLSHPGRQPHRPFLAISPHPNAAKFQSFPFNIQPLRPHLPLPAAHVTGEFHFLAVFLHFCRTCQALHPLPAPEQFQPLPHRHPPSGPPSPLLDPPPAACSQPALPAAGPALAPRSPPTAQFVQFNCNGIRSFRRELVAMLHSLGVAVCAVQETKLTAASSSPPTPGYPLVCRDHGGGGGGLAFFIRQDIQYSHLDTNQFFPGDPTTEHQGILANLSGHQIACLNIYIPPCTCCPAGFQPDLAPLLYADYGADVLVMGDFNAHHPAWFSVMRDDRALARGVNIAEAIDSSPLCLLNEDSPTRLPPNGTPSSPDLTIISGHLALTASWLPSISLNSDHLLILINLVEDPQDSHKSQPILHNNYRRADWASYTDFTESAFSTLPPPSSCSIGEKSFRNILRDASVRFIPRGSIPNYTPHFSDAAKRLASERERLTSSYPD